MKYRSPPRTGFTLVELMVAAALSLVIMTIMAVAFQSAMSTLSTLKSTGDQADRLRTAEVMLRADLNEDHIVGDDAGGTVKVSDLRFDLGAAFPSNGRGYFKVTTGSVSEGSDSDGIPSTKMSGPTANTLSMTVKRTSRTSADLFGVFKVSTAPYTVTDTLGPLTDGAQWAEVSWQLSPTAKLTVGTTSMYSLHRVVQPRGSTPPNSPAGFTLDPDGNDIVLTNVISFEVKPLLMKNGIPVSGTAQPATFIDSPYADAGWSTVAGAAVTSNRCVAVQVKIRLFDIKTKLTRQMTLIVKI